jgi:hypothetical protein
MTARVQLLQSRRKCVSNALPSLPHLLTTRVLHLLVTMMRW